MANETKKRVLITGATFPADVAEKLIASGLELESVPGDLKKEEVVAALQGAWGYVLGGYERMTEDVGNQLEELQVACFLGTGYSTFMQLPKESTQTAFTYTPHANFAAVAEFAVALMLDITRDITNRANQVTAGGWSEIATPSLIGAKVGIVGMGHIGQEVARILSTGFGAQVFYWNRTARPALDDLGFTQAKSILELCEQVDILSLHLDHQSGVTDHIVGASELAALGSNGMLVNTARAELVDPNALRTSLENNELRAAAIDGYYEEPTPSPDQDPYGLLKLAPKLLVTPHCAYLSEQALHRMAEMAAENLLSVLAGQVPPNAITLDTNDI